MGTGNSTFVYIVHFITRKLSMINIKYKNINTYKRSSLPYRNKKQILQRTNIQVTTAVHTLEVICSDVAATDHRLYDFNEE